MIRQRSLVSILSLLALALAACAPISGLVNESSSQTVPPESRDATPTTDDPSQGSDNPLTGAFAKLDPNPPQWWKCARCADYRPVGGPWTLTFENNAMHIRYAINGWSSTALTHVEGDRLVLSDDPYCRDLTGEYLWELDGGALKLELVEDGCAFGLRAENLTEYAWTSCAATPTAPGCASAEMPEPYLATGAAVQVTVHEGDARQFDDPPDLIVPANGEAVPPPEGIEISFDPASISYGYNRVLWWQGGSIEISSADPYTKFGVQFLGDPTIGWASVFFDGEEVWRGDPSAIWSQVNRHGGYIEVSGFPPGLHTLRVEVAGNDYRPVTVAFFGFTE